jgi:hypothetical protein
MSNPNLFKISILRLEFLTHPFVFVKNNYHDKRMNNKENAQKIFKCYSSKLKVPKIHLIST